jgi:hypothetical protein
MTQSKEVIRILERIEEVAEAPAQITALIKAQDYLNASAKLSRTLHLSQSEVRPTHPLSTIPIIQLVAHIHATHWV